MIEVHEIVVLSLCFLNLFILLSICNFLIKIANSLSVFRKELEDYYYVRDTKKTNNQVRNNENGLVDP